MTHSLQTFLRRLRQDMMEATIQNSVLPRNFLLPGLCNKEERAMLEVNQLPNTDAEIVALGAAGTDLITQERLGQIHREHYLGGDDDRWTAGQLALAAVNYASPVPVQVAMNGEGDNVSGGWQDAWQFSSCANKKGKHCRLKQLAIAGALIAAEIDRLQREIERIPKADALDESSLTDTGKINEVANP